MNIIHIFHTNNKYIQGTKQDYHDNAISSGYTFFKGYSTHNRPKSNLENVIKEVSNTTYDGIKYDAIQLYKDKCISTTGQRKYLKDKLIILC